MSYVVTLLDYTPIPREDGQAWTQVQIEEAVAEVGPWTVIDTQNIVPVDADPMAPAERSFTTVNAQLAQDGWYRVTFLDALGNEQQFDPQLQGQALDIIPTAADVRAASNVVFAELGYPPPVPPAPDRLQDEVDTAVAEFLGSTGFDLSLMDASDPKVPVVRKAIRQFVEYNVGASQPEVLATAYDYDLIENFSVGGYSESRRNNMRSGLSVRNMYHPWPELNRTLNILLHWGNLFGQQDKEGPSVASPALIPEPGREFMGRDLLPDGYMTGDGLYGQRLRIGGSGPPLVVP